MTPPTTESPAVSPETSPAQKPGSASGLWRAVAKYVEPAVEKCALFRGSRVVTTADATEFQEIQKMADQMNELEARR